MRITTVALAVAVLVCLSVPALAGAQKVNLVQSEGSPEPDAKGYLKIKYPPGAELFEVKIAGIVRGATYGFYIQTAFEAETWERFAELKARGAALKYKVNTRRMKGPGMPQGGTLADLAGRIVQVRNSGGVAILEAVIPAAPPEEPAPKMPALRILATDAPFPYESVRSAVVIVDRIELRKSGEPFATLVEYPEGKELDLVDLQNGVVSVLFAGDPEPGDYDAMRVIVRAKEITVLDGGVEKTFTEFAVPSGPQTGVKIFFDVPVTVVTELTTDLVLDFDLSRSFVVQGNPSTPAGIKGFHFQPVLKVVNASIAGTLTFLVMSDNGTPGDTTDDFYLSGAAYEVIDTVADPDATLATGASGTSPAGQTGYVFHPAIPAGTWTLQVSCADHVTAELPVTLYVANLTDAGTIVLTASSGTIAGTAGTTVTTMGGEPLAFIVDGATVTATAEGAVDPSGTDTTNTFGEFQLAGLPLGAYTVTASKAGYADDSATATPDVFGAPVTHPVSLELVPLTADVTGTVQDSNAAAVEGATVRAVMVYEGAEKVIAETTTGADGSYTLAGLPTGSYAIKAEKTVDTKTVTGAADLAHVGGGLAATVDVTVQ